MKMKQRSFSHQIKTSRSRVSAIFFLEKNFKFFQSSDWKSLLFVYISIVVKTLRKMKNKKWNDKVSSASFTLQLDREFCSSNFQLFPIFLGVKIKFAKAIETTKNLNKNSIGRYNVTQRKFSRKNEKSYELYSVWWMMHSKFLIKNARTQVWLQLIENANKNKL